MIPPALLARVNSQVHKLQMLPDLALKALEATHHPECSVQQFSVIAEQDLKLATDLLRLANCSLYSPPRPITDLNQAAVRLGMRQCGNLVINSSLTSLLEDFSMEEALIRDVLWRHGQLTAVIAQQINKEFNLGFQGEEFACGLLHDFGRILLAMTYPDEFNAIDALNFRESEERLRQERDAFGATHADLGAWFAMVNQLPPCFVWAIRYHHAPELAEEHRLLAATVAAADHLANHYHLFQTSKGYAPVNNLAIRILEDEGIMGARVCFAEVAADLLERSCRYESELAAMMKR